jgi:ribosome-associated protein
MTKVLHITGDVFIQRAELQFRFSRSGGPGGQNVNKVETRVEVLFDVANSPSLNDEQKVLILSNAKSRVDASGVLQVSAQESRSQWRNRVEAGLKLVEVLASALRKKKHRRPSKPTHSSREGRLRRKKVRGETKRLRGRVGMDT